MKLVMTLLVRDEEDILRENLDFHLAAGVDEVILMDNRSVDGTAAIAREYERAGHSTHSRSWPRR
ncbi:MAG TPA: glycosyltransferase family 2 protein [Solirubrobacteraceae bacterium]